MPETEVCTADDARHRQRVLLPKGLDPQQLSQAVVVLARQGDTFLVPVVHR